LALLPKGAQAHLVETGLGPVYDGVAHFVLSPEDYVPIVGLALLAGLRSKDQARLAVLLMQRPATGRRGRPAHVW
jgi:urease accessory protein